ncbi:uroporphyrinogen decarboxylase family protein [Planctomycetota bacterium]
MQLTPSIYEHAARLIEVSPWQASRDPELLFKGHARAFGMYHHAPIVVGIDIYNLEAEAYGGVISEPADNGIPAITEHPCADMDALLALQPLDATAGRIPMVLDVGHKLQQELPEADIRIPLSGPFSIATNLIGFENLLMAVMLEPEKTVQVLDHLVEGQLNFCRRVIERGLDIAFFESAAAPPLLSPDQFRDTELPVLKRIIEQTAAIAGHPVPCIIGGNTTPILEDMLTTGTGYVICPAEADQVNFMKIMQTHPQVMVRVNTDPEIISRGSWPHIQAELDRILTLVAGREKVCLGTGALPYETPTENVMRAIEYVKDK